MATTMDEYYRGLERAKRALAAGTAAGDADRAATVHAAMADAFDDTPDAAARACRTGCDHCCHFPVGVTFAEALRLLDGLADDDGLRRHVRAEAERLHDRDWHDLVGEPCPLLHDGACRIYQHRPLPCRALASRDADACAASRTGNASVPRDETAWWRGVGAVAALASDTPSGSRELRGALRALLAVDGGSPDAAAQRKTAFTAARRVPDGRDAKTDNG